MGNKFEAGQQKLIINANKKNSKTDSGGAQKDQATSDPLASIDKKDRPTHRLKMLIGKKVDTIEYGLTELPQMNRKVEELQQGVFSENSKKTQAAFVEFSSQAAAQDALQFAQQSKTKFSPRYIGVQPGEVIWKNLAMNKFSRKIKMAIATTAIVLLTIFWAIPVAVVGAISNINYLTEQVPFLSFINDIPSVILGVVTGLLPVILLAVLMALVPIPCQIRWCTYPLSCRTQDPVLVFRLPGHPGVLGDDIQLRSIGCGCTDCVESSVCGHCSLRICRKHPTSTSATSFSKD